MQPMVEKIETPPDSSILAFERSEARFPFEWHHHPEFELTMIVAGSGRRFIGDHVEDYDAGDLVLVGPQLPHTWRSEEPEQADHHRAIVVQFREEVFAGSWSQCPELRSIRRILSRSARGVQFDHGERPEVVERLTKLVDMRPVARLAALLELLDVLAETHRTRQLASEIYEVPHDDVKLARLRPVLETVHRDFHMRLRQSELAASIGLSAAAFSRMFAKATGVRFVDYVNNLRIGHACRMLIETDLPITDISFRSGFTNLSNFNRIFLRRRHMPPRQFRREYHA